MDADIRERGEGGLSGYATLWGMRKGPAKHIMLKVRNPEWTGMSKERSGTRLKGLGEAGKEGEIADVDGVDGDDMRDFTQLRIRLCAQSTRWSSGCRGDRSPGIWRKGWVSDTNSRALNLFYSDVAKIELDEGGGTSDIL